MYDILKVIAAVAPRVDAVTWAAALDAPMRSSGMTTSRRIAMFLGQCAEESAGFSELVENLHYSADHLCKEWPERFIPGSTFTNYCAADPEALANHVYANRMGNGDEPSGDGWTFRGRGIIQLTGRTNYSQFARSIGRPLDADFLAWCETPVGAAQSACWFWGTRTGILALSDAWDITTVTRRVNGGLSGLAARVLTCNRALAAIVGNAPQVPDRVAAASGESEADALMDKYNPGVPKA